MDGPIFSDERLKQLALQEALRAADAPKAPEGDTDAAPRDTLRIPRWAALLGSGAFDALSTRAALKSNPNAYEANPAMRGVAGNTGALLGTKLGVSAAIAMLMDILAKRGKTKAANGAGFGIAAGQTALGINNMAKRK